MEAHRFFGPIDGPGPDPATWGCKIGEVDRVRVVDAVLKTVREFTE